MAKFSVIRKHEIQTGHRIYGHPGKCANLHGHSYTFHFHCMSDTLDELGMVVDFNVIKTTLCQWLMDNYDHRLLIWENDPLAKTLPNLDPSVVIVPYNPSAENIANYLLTKIAPKILIDSRVTVNKVIVTETVNCSASAEL